MGVAQFPLLDRDIGARGAAKGVMRHPTRAETKPAKSIYASNDHFVVAASRGAANGNAGIFTKEELVERMSRRLVRLTIVVFAYGWLWTAMGQAQQLPPVEAPLPMPGSNSEIPTIRVTTNEVLVPTLVEKPHGGGIVYGLKQSDFVVEDNGIPQKIHVQEELDTAPVALVVAMEEGRAGWLEFQKLGKLGPLLEVFLSDPRSQAALVGFGSTARLIHDYTHSEEELAQGLQQLEPGDGGAAILDTISYGVDLLEDQPKEYRRVLLLISEERDHGSKHTKPAQLVSKTRTGVC